MKFEHAAKVCLLLLSLVAGAGHAEIIAGDDVRHDPASAARLLERAAATGDVDAMASLGRMYVQANGVPEDDVRGYAFLQAALTGTLSADLTDAVFYDLGVATSRLDPQHLARARLLARQLSRSVGATPPRTPTRSQMLPQVEYIETDLEDSDGGSDASDIGAIRKHD